MFKKKNLKSKKKLLLVLGGIALFLGAAITLCCFSQDPIDEKPPSLSFDAANLQGFSYDDSDHYIVVDDDYVDDMDDYEDDNDDLPDDEQEDLEDFDAGVNYIYFNEDYSFEEVLDRYVADEGTKLLLCRWDGDDQEFQCHPEGPYSGTKFIKKSRIDDVEGDAGTMWAFISSDDFSVWGANPSSGIISDNKIDWNDLDKGWYIAAYSESFLDDMRDYCESDRIRSIWVQDDDDSFEKQDLDEDTDMNRGYNLVWFKLKNDDGDCDGDYPTASDSEAPSDVEELTATGVKGAIDLKWKAASDNDEITSYIVYYGTHPVQTTDSGYSDYGWSKTIDLADLTEDSSSYFNYSIDKTGSSSPVSLSEDTDYYFAVKAVDATGNISKEYSNEVDAQIINTGPEAVTVVATSSSHSVTLVWHKIDTAIEYQVCYSTTANSTSCTLIDSSKLTNNDANNFGDIQYAVNGLKNNQTYYFKVITRYENNIESSSEELAITPVADAGAPAAVTDLKVVDLVYGTTDDEEIVLPLNSKASSINLEWNSVTNASSYNVHYGTYNGGPYENLINVTDPSYLITGLDSDKDYYVVVSAVSGSGNTALEGGYSNQVNEKTEALVKNLTVDTNETTSSSVKISFDDFIGNNNNNRFYSIFVKKNNGTYNINSDLNDECDNKDYDTCIINENLIPNTSYNAILYVFDTGDNDNGSGVVVISESEEFTFTTADTAQ